MSVLQQILEWSTGRPAWQRDALRRLVVTGDLSDEDINALSEICKSNRGLAEKQDTLPLTHDHIPDRTKGSPVSLVSICHHRGVNALAEDQTLNLGPSLTIVYGDNGAGKTGYVRILKRGCRSRRQEPILGNVVSGSREQRPEITLQYQVGTESAPREWTGDSMNEFLSRVSIFDTQCAAFYLTERTDVAFRPFGLDLFDKLVKACKSVRARLELEQQELGTSGLAVVQERIPEGTAVANLLTSVTSLTKPEEVKSLAHLSIQEENRLIAVERSLLDLQGNDPKKLLRLLTVQASRIGGLIRHLKYVETVLGDDTVKGVFDTRNEERRKGEEADHLRKATLSQGLLQGTGTDSWKALWESARHFSQHHAYPEKPFPVVENGGQCVLCQQNLEESAAQRLKQFENFIVSTVERERRQLTATFSQQKKSITDLKIVTEEFDEMLKEIRIDYEAVADIISAALVSNENRRSVIQSAIVGNIDLPPDCVAFVSVVTEAEALWIQIDERIKALHTSANDQTRRGIESEARELRARKVLAESQQIVLDDIERQKKYAAYGLCLSDTKTKAITTKSSAVTKDVVSEKLKNSFLEELDNLSFRHVKVELKDDGGSDGVYYHKLVLTSAQDAVLPKVMSEGEQRCLSIAAFFAELSTTDDLSGIVFDDPVSSLDIQWRDRVARRLVKEAKTRQVVVFTHDIVFLLALQRIAKELDVRQNGQHVSCEFNGAGVCSEELPWAALSVSKKIGYLKNAWQAAEKLSRTGERIAYEEKAVYLYGRLREAWERAIEEVLLAGIIERYRPGIQTQHIASISDIDVTDCKAVETAMTKCSAVLPGHDTPGPAHAPVPDSTELKADIDVLATWVADIRKRRS